MCDQGHDEIIDRLEKLEVAFREYNGEQCEIRDDVAEIKDFLIGNIKKENPGLAERVRRLEDWVGSQKRLIWLTASVLVTQIVGWIFVLIIK